MGGALVLFAFALIPPPTPSNSVPEEDRWHVESFHVRFVCSFDMPIFGRGWEMGGWEVVASRACVFLPAGVKSKVNSSGERKGFVHIFVWLVISRNDYKRRGDFNPFLCGWGRQKCTTRG
jgi:hypothetical protein